MTLIWGIRCEGTDEEKQRADWLFRELEEDAAEIVIPSVALAEYLVHVDPQRHQETIAPLDERFRIQPFDVKCAALAARLFLQGRSQRVMETEFEFLVYGSVNKKLELSLHYPLRSTL